MDAIGSRSNLGCRTPPLFAHGVRGRSLRASPGEGVVPGDLWITQCASGISSGLSDNGPRQQRDGGRFQAKDAALARST
jgi:hypothetical protein